MYPRDCHLIGAIEGFGFAKLKFSGFDGGRRHEREDRWVGVGRYDRYRWLDWWRCGGAEDG